MMKGKLAFYWLIVLVTILTCERKILVIQGIWNPARRGIGISSVFMESGIRDQGSTFCGFRDRNSHRSWDQGSQFWVKRWDHLRKNIPCYDPDCVGRLQFRVSELHKTVIPFAPADTRLVIANARSWDNSPKFFYFLNI